MVLIKKLLSISSIHCCRGSFSHMSSTSCALYLSIPFFSLHSLSQCAFCASSWLELFTRTFPSKEHIYHFDRKCVRLMQQYACIQSIKRVCKALNTFRVPLNSTSTAPWCVMVMMSMTMLMMGYIIHICMVYLKIYKCIQIYMRFALLYGLLTIVNDLECINTIQMHTHTHRYDVWACICVHTCESYF